MAKKKSKGVIVVIDDKADLADVYATALRSFGYDVSVHVGGEGAVDFVVSAKPDLVLSDMVMPGMGGVELISELQRVLGEKRPPVVLLTSMSSDVDRKYALSKGAADFWNKANMDVDTLVEKVSEFLAVEVER